MSTGITVTVAYKNMITISHFSKTFIEIRSISHYETTRSQAVAGIADRTAKNCVGHVT